MDIGRKVLNESDFSNLWGILYQEFYNLSVTNSCDATLVYNTIYIICTSGSSFENKLYWKIGDFLLNRSKIHRDQILESADYLKEYVIRFSEYEKLVESINSLGIFLNDSVREKKINEFGYLLWERMVIQSFTDSFFIDVYQYPGDVLKILKSFEKIVPDSSQKLLYYKEKYEKTALKLIRAKYSSISFSSLMEFCDITKIIITRETDHMKKRFLECSYESIKFVLEECLFFDRYYELLINLKNYFYINNLKSYQNFLINVDHNTNQLLDNINSTFGLDHNTCNVSFESTRKNSINNEIVESINYDNPFFSTMYERFDNEKTEITKAFLENAFENDKVFLKIQPILNKKINKIDEDIKFKAINPVFDHLMESVGALDAGFVLIKKAYALYIESVLKSNINILSSSLKQIYYLLEALDIFNDGDCKYILYNLFKQYLQKAKPCYMKRLCDFTNSMTIDDINKGPISILKPFESNDNLLIFRTSIQLIGDKSEFINMYQTTLKERLILGISDIYKETVILELMNISKDDKLFKMIEDIKDQRSRFKILNSTNWSIEPEDSSLPLPNKLLKKIMKDIPDLQIVENIQNDNNVEMKYKLSDEKVVQIAHQYTKIILNINGSRVQMNIYQYIIVDLLQKRSETMENLIKLSGIKDQVLKSMMYGLIEQRIVKCVMGTYSLLCDNVQDCDIFCIKSGEESKIDICTESYIQALSANILKRAKKIDMAGLINEIKGMSRLEVNEEFVCNSVKKLVEKGIADTKNNIIEYVF